MKKLLVLNSSICNNISTGGEFKNNQIYEVIDDILYVSNDDSEYVYTNEKAEELRYGFSDIISRHITVKDNNDEETCIEFYSNNDIKDSDAVFVFENDNQLAHKLIDMVDGLDNSIVKMYMLINN